MYPLIFNGVSTYALLLPIMIAVAAGFCLWSFHREGHRALTGLYCLIAITCAAVLGAKLFSLGGRGWPLPLNWSYELAGGWRFSGAIIGVAIGAPFFQRYFLPGLSLMRFGDILALSLLFGMSFGRLGCFLAGCCVGERGEGLLYLSFAPGSKVWYQQLHAGEISSHQWSEPVLALPLIFLVVSTTIAIVLYRFDKHRQYDGQVLLLFLAVHESSKALLELYRAPVIPEQLLATAIAGGLGILGLLYFRKCTDKLTFSDLKTGA